MLQIYSGEGGALRKIEPSLDAQVLKRADWIDIHDPTPDEEGAICTVFGLELAPDDMPRFHPPSDFKARDQAIEATILLLTGIKTPTPALVPVTFIHTEGPLISVTRGESNEIGWLIEQYAKEFKTRAGPDDAFAALLDMIVDHSGDALEYIGCELDRINRAVFAHHASAERRVRLASPRIRTRQLERLLEELGFTREILVKLRRSVLTLRRLIAVLKAHHEDEVLKARLAAFEKDLVTISEAESDMSNTAGFVLDGAVGFITIQQSKVVNILTIVGVLLSPAMAIGGIYGMNFKIMPELQWDYGYAWALGLIFGSTAVMYWLFRRRGWL